MGTSSPWFKYPNSLVILIQSTILLFAVSFISFVVAVLSFIPLAYTTFKTFFSPAGETSERKYKNVFITGGSSGIGKYLALKHAKEGANFIFITGRNQSKLESTVKEINSVNGKTACQAIAINIDVSDVDGMRHTLQQADDQCGGLDVIYANAGVSPENMKQLPPEVVTRQTFDVNIMGVVNTIYPVYDRFVQRQSGHYVIISSLASYGPIASAAYSASKSAVTTFGQALRRDLRQHNVDVTVVCPGYIQSGITEERHRVNGLPLIMDTDVGADIIYTGVIQRQGFLSFPFPLHAGAWLLRFLPFDYQDLYISFAHKHAYRSVTADAADTSSKLD